MCSVLFADLVGFTSLSESRDPEEVRELLSRYFDVARTVIDRYGGVVENAARTTAGARQLGQFVGVGDATMCRLLIAHALACCRRASFGTGPAVRHPAVWGTSAVSGVCGEVLVTGVTDASGIGAADVATGPSERS